MMEGKRVRSQTHTFMDEAADAAVAQNIHEGEVEAEVESDVAEAKAVKEGGFEITTVGGNTSPTPSHYTNIGTSFEFELDCNTLSH